MQCSWVKKLYDENFDEWKVIPLHLICMIFGQMFKFHSNLSYDTKLLNSFPAFYKNIFGYWSQHFTVSPEFCSCISSTFLRHKKDILISNKPIYFKHFPNNNLTKEWVKLKHKFNLNNNLYFNRKHLIHLIPQKWKNFWKPFFEPPFDKT